MKEQFEKLLIASLGVPGAILVTSIVFGIVFGGRGEENWFAFIWGGAVWAILACLVSAPLTLLFGIVIFLFSNPRLRKKIWFVLISGAIAGGISLTLLVAIVLPISSDIYIIFSIGLVSGLLNSVIYSRISVRPNKEVKPRTTSSALT